MTAFVLDFRDRSVGGAVTSGMLSVSNGPSGERAHDQLRLASHVVFLIHGYNVNREDGRSALSNLATFLTEQEAVVAVLWPGDSRAGFASYPFEGKDAVDSAQALSRFIRQRNAIRSGTRLSLVTHSLGARVGLETLKRLLGSNYPFREVCLMAPAIVDTALASNDEYRHTVEACGRVSVLSSKEDEVLRFAFPVGTLLEAFPLFRRTNVGTALGYGGPRPWRGSAVPSQVTSVPISGQFGVDHGDYLPDFVHGSSTNGGDQRARLLASEFVEKVLEGRPAQYG